SKYVWAIRWRSEEPGHGYGKVEPKNLHRFRGCQLDRDLRRARAQFCQEPSSGLHRAGGGSRRPERRSMAVYAFGPDGPGDPVSEMHALKYPYNKTGFSIGSLAWLGGHFCLGC